VGIERLHDNSLRFARQDPEYFSFVVNTTEVVNAHGVHVMTATIRFPDGTEATLLTEDGKWECADPDMKENLELRTTMLPYHYHPYPISGIAREIAKEVGAEVVHVSPIGGDDDPPGMIY
jgi:hypothetical protein